ncbi:MAG: LemA family protein [Cardiobacteriaceae bacterium]|nr:LemA family protein [Cardiobacteriaceae bacterium]
MKQSTIIILIAIVAVLAAIAIPAYNRLQGLDENVNAQWSEVVSQYQRRADLVPNLVESVKGYARHEEAVFTEVAAARARVGSLTLTPEMLGDEAALQRFQQAQGELTSALSRLLLVAENYPDLKASANFENLMTQLEGTENRITTARRNYIDSVQTFNTAVRTFPASLIARFSGLSRRAQFSVENEAAIATAPQVQF